ncbi:MAG: Gfo/Idh/MocA family oxidoreductase [Verrucomicrobia bacterium]|nr:Gfo/Idh/MocA family oxidoreductase [Verrucomicrobiota bacterium]
MKSNLRLTRRSFLKGLTAATATLAAPSYTRNLLSAAPNTLLGHASFGASGMAAADLEAITRQPGVRLLAVAEVDLNRTAELKKRFPEAKIYQDWRTLLEKEKAIDTVNVSTPDHMHGPIGMSALQLGKHVYGEKPLTHDIYETRQLTLVAREKRLVTQMGIQIHSASEYRTAVRLIQDLAIGKVKEVHTWSGKKWGDASPLPDRSDPIPAGFNWDLWLGVAAERPFIGGGYYHPGNWRKRLDFGTGTFGDMGCHIYDPVFKALALTAPLSVRSEGPAPNRWNWSVNAIIHYVFPGTPYTEGNTVKVTWYDGDERPAKDILALLGELSAPDQGSIFIGTKGVLLLPHIGPPQLLPEKQFETYPVPRQPSDDHWRQWVNACRGQGQASASFDYSGPLTESVLLGGVATHFPKTTLEWDVRAVKFSNVAEANQYVRRPYRRGWEVKGLSS